MTPSPPLPCSNSAVGALTVISLFSNQTFVTGMESSGNQPAEHSASTEQAPAPIEQVNAEDEETIVFRDPYIDPASGDWILNEFDIECIAIGAGIMGCGGGGSPYLGRLKALELIKAGKKIRVVHPAR